MANGDTAATRTGAPTIGRAWPAVLLAWAAVLGSGLFAWWGVWRGQYVFDDTIAIAGNGPLLAGDWWQGAFAPRHQPLANRPLACLSLVVDFALFGDGPFGPHLGNLLMHLANGLLLFHCLDAALRAPNVEGRVKLPRGFAAAVAAVWVAHPLGGDAVAYATQRSTLLASGFLLLALLASARAHAAVVPWRWRVVVVVALAAAMASKEESVVAPLLLVLFERAFLLPSWGALRARIGYYAGLASSWLVLAFCVATGPRNPTVGYATRSPVSAVEWLQTQAGVVLHYLRLPLWPRPLRGAHDWDVVRDLGPAVLPGLLVLLVLAATVFCWRRWPWLGWLGALWFLWLAPTSTIMPIVTELAAERRVYLPMLFVLVPVAVLVDRLAARRGVAVHRWARLLVTAAAVLLAGVAARDRVRVYADPFAFWDDAMAKRTPGNRTFLAGLILSNAGDALLARGRVEEAGACYDESMRCDGPTANAISRYAYSLLVRRRQAEAVAVMRRLVAMDPDENAAGTLGVCLAVAHETEKGKPDEPRLAEAERLLRRGLAVLPDNVQFWSSLAYVSRVRGDFAAAADAYLRVATLAPAEPLGFLRRAEALERSGRGAEVGGWMRNALAAQPRNAALRVHWAAVCLDRGDRAWASALLREALAIEPGNADAARLLQRAQAETGR